MNLLSINRITDVKKSRFTAMIVLFIALFQLLAQSQNSECNSSKGYYEISNVPIPDHVYLEVGGLAFDDNGRLGITTRRGEMWLVENPGSDQPIFKKFASGLHEPLGLALKDGSFYLAQRGELTKLTDADGDDRADIYENIYTWDLVGNYHEYAYGPRFLPNGNMLVWLNLGWVGRGASLSKWSGWILEVTPSGEMIPFATGLRSPASLGFNAAGDIFYTENQGDWVGAGRMTHMERGDFAGHPEGLKWSDEEGSPLSLKMSTITDSHDPTLYEQAQKTSELKPPSVWFPHTLMGIATSDISVIPANWGPFEGQFLVGDQGHSKIMRVYQEKVNGVYQGICFPFVEGFSSGVLRMEWGHDNALYVGMTNRGWSSTGKAMYGLQRLKWTGKVPFEMQKVNITKDGFEIAFTEKIDRRRAANPDSYSITDFTYKYHRLYGSPVINQEERTVYKVEVAQDNRSVQLFVEGLRLGYINEIKTEGIKSADGKNLLHNVGYYTINEIPSYTGEQRVHADHTVPVDYIGSVSANVERLWTKRITEMPSSWTNGPDQVLEIEAIPGMLFDKKEMRVKAGAKVKLTFDNPDDMMHNILIVNPGTADKVAQLAIDLGLKGMEHGYIPDSDDVLAHSTLLSPHSKDVIYFEVPKKRGTYQYVCTFPGHAPIMRGVLIVE